MGLLKIYVLFDTVSLFKTSRPEFVLGTSNILLNGYRVLSRGGGVKRPEREVDHSPPSSAKVKNEGSRTCTPSRCLYGMHRDNCTLTVSLTSLY